jgi:hypothetical protein
MNPAVDGSDSINPAPPILTQEFTAISACFIELEPLVLCQEGIDSFDFRTGNTGFSTDGGRTTALAIAPVRPFTLHSGPGFKVCQSTPEDFQSHCFGFLFSAFLTRILLSATLLSFKFFTAAFASPGLGISTKAKPLEAPVALSNTN